MDFTAQINAFQANNSLPKSALEALTRLFEHAQKEAEKHLSSTQEELLRAQTESQHFKIHIEKLTLELAYLRRQRFGAKSETYSIEQADLFQENFSTDIAAIEAELAKKMAAKQTEADAQPTLPRARAGRQPLPEHLPRVDFIHAPASCDCGQCGKALIKIGADVTEKLTVQPAAFSVERHIYPKYACRTCETVTAVPVAPAIIDGGYASVDLLVWIIVSKFVDHLPLYRLEQIAARHQVPLPRSNLAEWVGKVGVALHPLAARLAQMLRQRSVLHADETPVAQLDPKSGKNKRAYIWVYRSNSLEHAPPIVVFDYQIGRSGSHARAFLEGWQGHLMVDDYAGYKALFQSGINKITELGCMVHARRKFFDLHAANHSPLAAKALEWFGLLYQIEKSVENSDIDARQACRQTQSKPVLAEFHEWLVKTRSSTSPGSAIMKAIDYSLRRWPALIRYADTGHLPIDNNPAENAVRPIAIGRKNWLHYGSERAGQRAADIQTLLATAKLNDLNPEAWLADVLEKLPTWPHSRLDELLPLRGYCINS